MYMYVHVHITCVPVLVTIIHVHVYNRQLRNLLHNPVTTRNVAMQLAFLGGGRSSGRVMTTPTISIQKKDEMMRNIKITENP